MLMADIEENKRNLIDLQEKLKSLGDSLWRFKIRTRVAKIRRENNSRWILEWAPRVK